MVELKVRIILDDDAVDALAEAIGARISDRRYIPMEILPARGWTAREVEEATKPDDDSPKGVRVNLYPPPGFIHTAAELANLMRRAVAAERGGVDPTAQR